MLNVLLIDDAVNVFVDVTVSVFCCCCRYQLSPLLFLCCYRSSWFTVEGIEDWSKTAGKEKKTDTLRLPPDGLKEALAASFQDKVGTVPHRVINAAHPLGRIFRAAFLENKNGTHAQRNETIFAPENISLRYF